MIPFEIIFSLRCTSFDRFNEMKLLRTILILFVLITDRTSTISTSTIVFVPIGSLSLQHAIAVMVNLFHVTYVQ